MIACSCASAFGAAGLLLAVPVAIAAARRRGRRSRGGAVPPQQLLAKSSPARRAGNAAANTLVRSAGRRATSSRRDTFFRPILIWARLNAVQQPACGHRGAPARMIATTGDRGYAAQFTEQELKDMLAFYKSPLGKKLLEGAGPSNKPASGADWINKFAEEVIEQLSRRDEKPATILSGRQAGQRGRRAARSIFSSSAPAPAACAPRASRPAMARG